MPRKSQSAEDKETARLLRQYTRERVRGMGQARAQRAVAATAKRQAGVAAKRTKAGGKPLKRQPKGLSLTDVNYIIATKRKKGYPLNVAFSPTRKRAPAKKTPPAAKTGTAPPVVRRAVKRVAATTKPLAGLGKPRKPRAKKA